MDSAQNWLTVREVASELQVHEETVRRWIRAGELLALELGGPRTMYRIRPADLGTFMRRRTRSTLAESKPEAMPTPPARLHQIVERLPIITFVFDPNRASGRGSLLFISPEVEQILGVPAEEWYENLDNVWPTLMSEEQYQRLAELGLRLRTTREHFTIDVRMLNRQTGRPVWVSLDMEIDRQDSTGQELWYGLLIDITERKLMEERLRSHSGSLNCLASALIEDMSMDEMVGALFDALTATLPVGLARLHLVSAGRHSLTTYTRNSNGTEPGEASELRTGRTEIADQPLVRRVIESDEPQRIADLRREAILKIEPELRASGVRSALATPVRGQSRTVAVIEVFHQQSEAFRPSDRTYLEAAGGIVALALARQESRWLTVQDVAELLDVRSETVRRWIRNGELVAALPGGVRAGYRIDTAQLDTFLERRQSGH